MNNKPTKPCSLDASIREKATKAPGESLYEAFLAGLGVSCQMLIEILYKIFAAGDHEVAMLCIASSTQIRANVVYALPHIQNFETRYPELVVSGFRGTGDKLNFRAVHVLGHAFCMIGNARILKDVLKKHGNCITGEDCDSSEAGKINLELSHNLGDFVLYLKPLLAKSAADSVDGLIASKGSKLLAVTRSKPVEKST